MAMICPNCKHENPDGAQFCNGCGGKFVVKVEVVKAAEPEKPKKKVKDPGCVIVAVVLAFIFCLIVVVGYGSEYLTNVMMKNNSTQSAGAQKHTAVKLKSSTNGPTLTRTVTLTRTITPTASSTSTPLPAGTLTAQAKETMVKNTGQAKTGTAAAVGYQKTKIASYTDLYWKELSTYPDKYIGQKVIQRGRVMNVVNNQELQIYFAGTYELFYVFMARQFDDIYEGDAITVYGEVGESYCYDTVIGGHMCTPLLTDAFYTK